MVKDGYLVGSATRDLIRHLDDSQVRTHLTSYPPLSSLALGDMCFIEHQETTAREEVGPSILNLVMHGKG